MADGEIQFNIAVANGATGIQWNLPQGPPPAPPTGATWDLNLRNIDTAYFFHNISGTCYKSFISLKNRRPIFWIQR